jgi:hypothetical protein
VRRDALPDLRLQLERDRHEADAGEDLGRGHQTPLALLAALAGLQMLLDRPANGLCGLRRAELLEEPVQIDALAPAAPHQQRRGDRLLQRVAQSRQTRVDGALGEGQMAADLVRVEPPAEVQVEQGVLLRVERGRRVPDQLHQLAVLDDRLGVGEPARIYDRKREAALLTAAARRGFGKPLPQAELIDRQVVRNGVEPGFDVRDLFLLAGGVPGLDERALDDVRGEVVVAHDPEREVIEPLEVAPVERCERLPISLLGAVDQLSVGGLPLDYGRHDRPFPARTGAAQSRPHPQPYGRSTGTAPPSGLDTSMRPS